SGKRSASRESLLSKQWNSIAHPTGILGTRPRMTPLAWRTPKPATCTRRSPSASAWASGMIQVADAEQFRRVPDRLSDVKAIAAEIIDKAISSLVVSPENCNLTLIRNTVLAGPRIEQKIARRTHRTQLTAERINPVLRNRDQPGRDKPVL